MRREYELLENATVIRRFNKTRFPPKGVAGGKEGQCGWLTDPFGVSWQVVPSGVMDVLKEPDPQKSKRVMHAMMQMKKLDLAALQRARDQA